MKYRYLGNSGLLVSRICLGTMTFGMKDWGCDYPTSSELTNTFIQAGGNFIDTADTYSNGISEELVGKAIAAHRRDDLVIATKGWFRMGKTPNNKGLSRKHIMEAANASLQRLGTDYIDLYQMHGPDPHTPIEDLPPEQDTRLANVVPIALGYPREWIEITKSNTTGHEYPDRSQKNLQLLKNSVTSGDLLITELHPVA